MQEIGSLEVRFLHLGSKRLKLEGRIEVGREKNEVGIEGEVEKDDEER